MDALPIEQKGQPCVQVSIMPKAFDDQFVLKFKLLENFRIRSKLNKRAISLFGFTLFLIQQHPFRKLSLCVLPISKTSDKKMGRKGIDSFCAHSVQTDRKLKHIIVILSSRID